MAQTEAAQLWEIALTLLEQQGGDDRPSLLAICGKLTPQTLSEDELVLSTPNEYAKSFIERIHWQELVQAIRFASGKELEMRIVVSDEPEPIAPAVASPQLPPEINTENNSPTVSNTPAFNAPETNIEAAPILAERITQDPFSKTFETLIVGESNKLAFQAARSIAESPGRHIFNPLFIYGKSGLGKTHILLSIEDYVRTNHPRLKVVYTRTSDFIDDFTSMVGSRDNTDFNRKYHLADVLIIDDIQYIVGKAGSINAIYDIFNTFIEQNKQIVLSSDRNPNTLELDDRHRSRFIQSGPIDIQPATFEMKLAIFENYLDFCCTQIQRPDIRELFYPDVINRIVELSSSNIRELQGITTTLVSYLAFSGNPRYERLSIIEAEEQIQRNFRLSNKQVDIPAIQNAVEDYFHISHSDILGAQRSQDISYPRQIAMYLARGMTQHSFPSIGRAFGGKDHSTVMYACDNIEKRYMESIQTKEQIENIKEMILQ
jgi:chromosomal replication initiator protein